MIGSALWFVFTFQSLLAIACIWLRVAARLYNPSKPRTMLWRFILALDQTCLGPILTMLFMVPFCSFYAYLLAAGNFILAGLLSPLIYLTASIGFWVSEQECPPSETCGSCTVLMPMAGPAKA
jgi:hypothetical protein